MPVPIVVIGRDERILTANGRAVELLGPVVEGRHYITALRQPDLLDAIEDALVDRQIRTTRYLGSEAGKDTTWRVTLAPIELAEGAGLVLSFEDVTAMETAGQMRRDFVANVSHELRTPLTALLGFIETLKGAARDDPVARDRFLSIMQSEAGRMSRLVKDLLSLSRVEEDERVRPTTRVELGGLVRSAAASFEPLAKRTGSAVIVDLPEVEIVVQGDADQLSQVLSNLIENALKYGTKGGRVTVGLQVFDHEPSLRGRAARIDVQDDGEGIDPFHIARLTERFYRVDSHRSRELGGTGLGLAIVKHIVNRHRGRLRISSEKGQGSCFSVVLPAD